MCSLSLASCSDAWPTSLASLGFSCSAARVNEPSVPGVLTSLPVYSPAGSAPPSTFLEASAAAGTFRSAADARQAARHPHRRAVARDRLRMVADSLVREIDDPDGEKGLPR